jgi:hypothetical protein
MPARLSQVVTEQELATELHKMPVTMLLMLTSKK